MPTPHETIVSLAEQRYELLNKAEAIQVTAEGEGRDMTTNEVDQIQNILSQASKMEEDINYKKNAIGLGQKVKDLKAAAQQSSGRLAGPMNPLAGMSDPKLARMNGFNSIGEFAASVKTCSQPRAQIDPRLVMNAPTSFSSESSAEDGGYAAPPEVSEQIWVKVEGEESLIGMTDQYTATRNTMTFPADETAPWDPPSAGGIQCYFEGEGAQMTQSKVALQGKLVRLNKVICLVPVTSELLEDAPALNSYLPRKVADKLGFKLNQKVIAGSGVGEPLGILNSKSLFTVAKETSQAASTIMGANIMKMWSAMYDPCRRKGVWIANQDTETQLMQMYLAIKNVAGTDNVGGWPLYIPPGLGLSTKPYGTLMGRPVIPSQACSQLGSPGDIIFADLSQYLGVKKSGGPQMSVSSHLWFDYDILAFKWTFRWGGEPWWMNPVTPANDATNLLSWAVALATRS